MSNRGLEFLLARGLSIPMLQEFQVGYQDETGQVSGSSFPTELKGQLSSKFNGCVLIPFHDLYGTPLSFMGRRLAGQPKFDYLSGFKAHNHLFGLHKAVAHLVQQDYAILVEGAFDAIMCHQYGLLNTVSVLGTSVTHAQLCLLSRFVSKWVVAFDGDNAGQTAAKKLQGMGKKYGIDVRTLPLPPGQDPDEFLQHKGVQGWHELLHKHLGGTFTAPKTQTTLGTSFIQAKVAPSQLKVY